jgi:hypothetical protein
VDSGAFEKYLVDRYQDQTDWYQAKASVNKKQYQRLQWGVIVLAAIVPVLVTLTSITPDTRGWVWGVTILFSMLLAVGTAGIKTFKFQENWINYRATAERLIQEKIFFDTDIGEYRSVDDKESLFVERVETIIAGENVGWVSTQNLKQEASV